MNYYFFENCRTTNFYPISVTRPIMDIRIGVDTFLDRFIKLVSPDDKISIIVRKELADLVREKYTGLEVNPQNINEGIWLAGHIFWNEHLLQELNSVSESSWLIKEEVVGYNLSERSGKSWMESGGPVQSDFPGHLNQNKIPGQKASFLWEILERIPETLSEEIGDTKSVSNEKGHLESIHIIGKENIYISDSAIIEPSVTINAEKGPIKIMDNTHIQSLTYLEGPLIIGQGTTVKPHTYISSSVIGPVCKVGGEIAKSIFQGYSNKVHDGHLGNSFLGEWVNLGAGTTNSNLKNNYSEVYINLDRKKVNTGSSFIGSFIGDHVKTGIGTQLNTGSVYGPCSSIVSSGLAPQNVEPFSWIVNGNQTLYQFEKFIDTAKKVMQRRNRKLSRYEISFFKQLILQKKIG
tara:strand:- start:1446 stop:2663 length:1218 start_codon:yes stop_codon:yes gene_type:complete